MTPAVEEILAAVDDLAWRPIANLGNAAAYRARKDAHDRLVAAVAGVRTPQDPPELRLLVRAARRVAVCSFANRRGPTYYARRQAMAELRGALDVWRKSCRPV